MANEQWSLAIFPVTLITKGGQTKHVQKPNKEKYGQQEGHIFLYIAFRQC